MPDIPLKTKVPTKADNEQQSRQAFLGIYADLQAKAQKSASGYLLIDSTLRAAWQSPNGHWWTVTMNDSGAFVSTDVGLTPP